MRRRVDYRLGKVLLSGALIALVSAGCNSESATKRPNGQSTAPSASASRPPATPFATPSPSPEPTPIPTIAPSYAPAGKFVATGSMKTGRDGHTATLLLDGRVLIAGGEGYDEGRSAELYDPATGKFTRTGSMKVGRFDASATLLRDGRVLILGGWEYTDRTRSAESATAELYDPRTGTFARTGSMPAPRSSMTSTRLLDGRVLVAGGGAVNSSEGTDTALLYDPATGKFSPTGPMTRGHMFHTATLLLDGRVLIAGGNGVTAAELYEPATGTFSGTASMIGINGPHFATRLLDGRVLVAGGDGVSLAQVYDPIKGTFTDTGSMIDMCNCSFGTAVTAPLLADGRVLVPDLDTTSDLIGSAELYDPVTGTFTRTGLMSRYRVGFTDTLLGDGRVLFAGNEGPHFAMAVPSFSRQEAAAIAANRASAELYVP